MARSDAKFRGFVLSEVNMEMATSKQYANRSRITDERKVHHIMKPLAWVMLHPLRNLVARKTAPTVISKFTILAMSWNTLQEWYRKLEWCRKCAYRELSIHLYPHTFHSTGLVIAYGDVQIRCRLQLNQKFMGAGLRGCKLEIYQHKRHHVLATIWWTGKQHQQWSTRWHYYDPGHIPTLRSTT